MLNVAGLGIDQMVRTKVADGDRGTAQTIPYARKLVQEGIVDPAVRLLAVDYCSGVQANDEVGEMRGIFEGVRRDFRFIKDPVGTQLLQPTAGVLKTHAGNCATLNLILFPSLLGSVGYPTRAVTIKSDSDRPSEFSHVYIEAQLASGDWVPFDVACSNPEFGKAPDAYWDRKEWPLTSGGSAGAFMNGYKGASMRSTPQVVISRRTRRSFPRRGMGDDFLNTYGITQADYLADQAPDTYSPSTAPSLNLNQALATSLATAPSILTGVAQVVKANNTPGIAVSGVVGGAGTAVGTSAGSGLGLLLLLGAGIAVVMAMKG